MRLEVLSDQGDTLRTSLIHTFLLTIYLYTTFVMISIFILANNTFIGRFMFFPHIFTFSITLRNAI
jgi:hypothetical protein